MNMRAIGITEHNVISSICIGIGAERGKGGGGGGGRGEREKREERGVEK